MLVIPVRLGSNGTSLEAQGPISPVNSAASNKVESEDQSPRLSSDLNMCHSKRASQSYIIKHTSDSEITSQKEESHFLFGCSSVCFGGAIALERKTPSSLFIFETGSHCAALSVLELTK